MFILKYNGNKAAVVINEKYTYDFDSKKEAKEMIDAAEKIYVQYEPGRGKEMPISLAIKQGLTVIDRGSTYEELAKEYEDS